VPSACHRGRVLRRPRWLAGPAARDRRDDRVPARLELESRRRVPDLARVGRGDGARPGGGGRLHGRRARGHRLRREHDDAELPARPRRGANDEARRRDRRDRPRPRRERVAVARGRRGPRPGGANAVGSIPDAERIAAAAHSVGALAWADAVHMAPHRRLRAGQAGLDVQICSPYKFFGPHLGIAAIRPDLAESLPADRVRPADETPPGHRFEAGTQSHEAVAGATAAIEYLGDLGGGDLDSAFALIEEHETQLSARFLSGLPDGVELYGIRTPEGRTPTFC